MEYYELRIRVNNKQPKHLIRAELRSMENRPVEQTKIQPRSPVRIHITTLEKIVFWSTMLGVFSGPAGIRFVFFTVTPFYGIMLCNLLLLSILVGFRKIPVWVICLFLYLTLSGAIGVANGTVTVLLVMKSLIGLTISPFYYFYFFKMKNNSYKRAFLAYTEVAVWFAVAGLPVWIFECIRAHQYVRLHGLSIEPAVFSVVILPATYWHINQLILYRKGWVKVAILLLTLILANSALGFLGIIFGTMLLISRYVKHFLIVPVVACIVAALIYTHSDIFQRRVDDTLLSISSEDLSQANLSTYSLLSNGYVALRVLEGNPLLGNGLGSHFISHHTYVDSIPGVEIFQIHGDQDTNAEEAGSLALRVFSELGLIGFSAVLIFLFYFYVGGSDMHSDICRAILVCFFVKLIRDGTYFGPEQFFFIYVYMLNYHDWRQRQKLQLSEARYCESQ
jgi:hypothetical protein